MKEIACQVADVLGSELSNNFVNVAVVIGGEIEEEVHSGLAGDGSGALLLQHKCRKHRGADVFEFGIGDALRGDFCNFTDQFTVCERKLFGSCGNVKGDHADIVSMKLSRTDLIGETEFFANASEERAGHVGAVFEQHRARETSRICGGEAGVTDGDDGLFFLAVKCFAAIVSKFAWRKWQRFS